jgi:WD40 repeat protein
MPSDSAYVKFSPDGRWLAVAKFPGLKCRLWHVGSWRPGPTIQVSTEFFTMAFARGGRLLAIDDAGRVRLVSANSGREVATLDAGTGSSSNFFSLAFSPDGTYVAAGRDHIIHLWNSRLIREQLAPLGLDLDLPTYPLAGPHQDAAPIVVVSSTSDAANPRPINPERPEIELSRTRAAR